MIHKAISLEGTCTKITLIMIQYCATADYMYIGTGEHGVGLGKKEYLTAELGEGTIALMKTIKATLDPHNLFNPGKVCIR